MATNHNSNAVYGKKVEIKPRQDTSAHLHPDKTSLVVFLSSSVPPYDPSSPASHPTFELCPSFSSPWTPVKAQRLQAPPYRPLISPSRALEFPLFQKRQGLVGYLDPSHKTLGSGVHAEYGQGERADENGRDRLGAR